MSHSQSTISTPSSLACESAARSSLARWSATKTVIGSATSAARRGSSSSWRSRSAEGSGRPPTASPASAVVPGQDPRLTLIQADLSDLADLGEVPAIAGRRFDRIVFLQSLGYVQNVPSIRRRPFQPVQLGDHQSVASVDAIIPTPSACSPLRCAVRSVALLIRVRIRPGVRSSTSDRTVPSTPVNPSTRLTVNGWWSARRDSTSSGVSSNNSPSMMKRMTTS
jgi:hypothetical protein